MVSFISDLLNKAGIRFHNVPALLAGPFFQATIEILEPGLKILFDIVQYKPVFVQKVVAIFTIPLEAVLHLAVFAFAFYHQTHGIWASPGLVGHIGWQKKHFSLLNWNRNGLAFFLHPHFDIAFELVKELLGFVVVVIFTRVRTTYDHHDVVACIVVQVFITDGGFENIPVVGYPLLEIEGPANHGGSFLQI